MLMVQENLEIIGQIRHSSGWKNSAEFLSDEICGVCKISTLVIELKLLDEMLNMLKRLITDDTQTELVVGANKLIMHVIQQ